MPVHYGKDSKGCYAQYGTQKKYYYECGNESERKKAGHKAHLQGAAIEKSGYKENVMEPQLYTFIVNLKPTVRYETLEDKSYMVVPMVMMAEGVHNGTGGPVYYSGEELSRTPVMWNHKPIVVYHPMKGGMPQSACDAEVLNKRKIGLIMNAVFENGKLKAEAWLDPERTKKIDERIVNAIDKKEMMEVSIGVYVDSDKSDGEWNGEHYDAVARNLRPDHLAVLPDEIGACSVADGAGLFRLNSTNRKQAAYSWASAHGYDLDQIDLAINEMSHEKIRGALYSLLRDKHGEDAWIDEVYNGFVIYAMDGKLYKQSYSETDEEINFEGNAVEVIRVVEYRTTDGVFVANAQWATAYINDLPDSAFLYIEPGGKKDSDGKTTPRGLRHFPYKDKNGKVDEAHVRNALSRIPQSKVSASAKRRAISRARKLLKSLGGSPSSNTKGTIMNKEEMIDAMIDNETSGWTEAEREFLMQKDEKWLEQFMPKSNQKADPPPKQEDQTKETKKKEVEVKTSDEQQAMTANEYITILSNRFGVAADDFDEVLQTSLATHNEAKAKIIAEILGNKNCTFTKEQLEAKKLLELQQLRKLASNTEQRQRTVPLYGGQAEVTSNTNIDNSKGLGLPKMEFSKAAG